MTVPRVSVLTAFLDPAPFMVEAVESVLAQRYDSWELILIDDGSTDGSTELARAFAARHPGRIVYLEHERHAHRGKSAALNLGLRHARGEYVAILDADDVWMPEKLAAQVHLLDAHPEVGMLYSNTLIWRSWTGRADDKDRDVLPDLGVPVGRLAPDDLLIRWLRGTAAIPCTCSLLMRRATLERVGGCEESFTRLFTDQAMYVKLALAARVFVAAGVWDRYRIHPASAVSRAKRENGIRPARQQFLDFTVGYLRVQGHARDRLWWTARRERWLNARPLVRRLVGAAHARLLRAASTLPLR